MGSLSLKPLTVSSAQNSAIGDPHSQASRSKQRAVFFRCQAQRDFRLIAISTNVVDLWGYTDRECLNNATLWLAKIHPDDLSIFRQQLCSLGSDCPQTFECRFLHAEGSYRWLQFHLLLTGGDRTPEVQGCCQDITPQRQAETEKKLLQSVVESSFHVLAQTHYRTGVTKALAAVGAALGIDRAYICEYRADSDATQQAMTMSFAWSREGWSISPKRMPWWHQSAADLQEMSSYQNLRDNGYFVGITHALPAAEQPLFSRANIRSTLWLPIEVDRLFWGFAGLDHCQREGQWAPESIGLLRTWTAIIGGALRHHQSEERLVHDVFHDSLTGLPNRALFLNRLEQSLRRSLRHPTHIFAVLFLDLDGFKAINDTLGHQVGDQLLVAIAQRLAGCLRPGGATPSRVWAATNLWSYSTTYRVWETPPSRPSAFDIRFPAFFS